MENSVLRVNNWGCTGVDWLNLKLQQLYKINNAPLSASFPERVLLNSLQKNPTSALLFQDPCSPYVWQNHMGCHIWITMDNAWRRDTSLQDPAQTLEGSKISMQRWPGNKKQDQTWPARYLMSDSFKIWQFKERRDVYCR